MKGRLRAPFAVSSYKGGLPVPAKDSATLVIVPPRIFSVDITIQGTSPLITHKFSERAIDAMLAKQQKLAAKPREAKEPQQDFEESIYRTESGEPGFPALGINRCMVNAARFVDGLKMTVLRGAIQIPADTVLPVIGDGPQMRRDMVRLQGGVADVRFRAQWQTGWQITVPVRFNAGVLSVDQVVNLLNVGGFGVGVGEWRPERNGDFGRFEVVSVANLTDQTRRVA